MNEIETWSRLHDAERKWIYSHHPGVAFYIFQARGKAIAERDRRYPQKYPLRGKRDAFLHAYWSALMVRAIGPELATEFGDVHEDFPDNEEIDRKMDLHNNEVGRTIGMSNVSDQGLIQAIVDETGPGGRLWYINR